MTSNIYSSMHRHMSHSDSQHNPTTSPCDIESQRAPPDNDGRIDEDDRKKEHARRRGFDYRERKHKAQVDCVEEIDGLPDGLKPLDWQGKPEGWRPKQTDVLK